MTTMRKGRADGGRIRTGDAHVVTDEALVPRRRAGSAMVGSLVAVIGPPGAGKTTVVGALAQSRRLPVFRLREAVVAYTDMLADLEPTTDLLGWVGVQALQRILRAAFIDGRFNTGVGPVLLDNFPGTARQLHRLAEIAAVTGRRVAILELRADEATVAVRVAARRICPTCSPNRHAAVIASATDPHRCAQCDGQLARRDSDIPTRHALRLARYRANVAEIVEHAGRLQVPHLAILADHPPHVVHRSAQEAFARLADPAGPMPGTTKGADHDDSPAHAYSSS
ncbi:MAG: AAA family ATPase [Pseudonocardiaceae bacterium]